MEHTIYSWARTQSAKEIFMAFCSHCGTKLEENLKFCTQCGTRLNGEESRLATQHKPIQPVSQSVRPVSSRRASQQFAYQQPEIVIRHAAQKGQDVSTGFGRAFGETIGKAVGAIVIIIVLIVIVACIISSL
jgi:hypothetical protein